MQHIPTIMLNNSVILPGQELTASMLETCPEDGKAARVTHFMSVIAVCSQAEYAGLFEPWIGLYTDAINQLSAG
jgi:hypothetical protein